MKPLLMKAFRVRPARLAILGLPLVVFGVGLGCLGEAEHTYFDDLLDGSTDGTTTTKLEASSGIDASMDSDGEVVVTDDGGVPTGDDGAASGDVAVDDDAMLDAAADAPTDAPVVVVEAGCGPTDTVSNCGACGVACDTTHSSPSACVSGATCSYSACTPGWGDCDATAPNTNGCETQLNVPTNCTGCGVACDTKNSVGAGCTGSTCTYTGCKAGWSMCNTTAPNLAGCACNTPGCCDGGCETTHTNGVSSPGATPYYDCSPLKTYTSTEAFKACAAYTDAQALCSGGWKCNNIPQPVICDNACTICWVYGGATAGQVTDCTCPGTQSGTWN